MCIRDRGYTLVAIGCLTNFYIVMVGVLAVGMGSAFGEVSHYGFIERFPSVYVGAFSTGSGICGIFSTLFFLLLNTLKIPNYIVFFCLVPLSFLYLLNFLVIHKFATNHNYFQEQGEIEEKDHAAQVEEALISESNTIHHHHSSMDSLQTFMNE